MYMNLQEFPTLSPKNGYTRTPHCLYHDFFLLMSIMLVVFSLFCS